MDSEIVSLFVHWHQRFSTFSHLFLVSHLGTEICPTTITFYQIVILFFLREIVPLNLDCLIGAVEVCFMVMNNKWMPHNNGEKKVSLDLKGWAKVGNGRRSPFSVITQVPTVYTVFSGRGGLYALPPHYCIWGGKDPFRFSSWLSTTQKRLSLVSKTREKKEIR